MKSQEDLGDIKLNEALKPELKNPMLLRSEDSRKILKKQQSEEVGVEDCKSNDIENSLGLTATIE